MLPPSTPSSCPSASSGSESCLLNSIKNSSLAGGGSSSGSVSGGQKHTSKGAVASFKLRRRWVFRAGRFLPSVNERRDASSNNGKLPAADTTQFLQVPVTKKPIGSGGEVEFASKIPVVPLTLTWSLRRSLDRESATDFTCIIHQFNAILIVRKFVLVATLEHGFK